MSVVRIKRRWWMPRWKYRIEPAGTSRFRVLRLHWAGNTVLCGLEFNSPENYAGSRYDSYEDAIESIAKVIRIEGSALAQRYRQKQAVEQHRQRNPAIIVPPFPESPKDKP